MTASEGFIPDWLKKILCDTLFQYKESTDKKIIFINGFRLIKVPGGWKPEKEKEQ